MEQYSIVIPTMFKSTRIFEMLEKLNDCDAVGEIILIDNTESTTPHSEIPAYSKLRYINEGHNTGVNPAWNRGVELAKYELVALVSDDITFNPNIFKVLTNDVLEQFGLIGMSSNNFNKDQTDAPSIQLWYDGMEDTHWGWGTLIIFQKKNWVDIPLEIVVWFGDTFVKWINPAPKGVLKNFRVDTEMSTTVDLPEFDSLKASDGRNWSMFFNNWKQTLGKK